MKDISFYGLFMDESILRAKGVEARAARRAIVRDYQFRIGQRAMLVRQSSSRTYGMVYALTDDGEAAGQECFMSTCMYSRVTQAMGLG